MDLHIVPNKKNCQCKSLKCYKKLSLNIITKGATHFPKVSKVPAAVSLN